MGFKPDSLSDFEKNYRFAEDFFEFKKDYKFVDDRILSFEKKIRRDLEKICFDELRISYVHADLSRENMLVSGGRIVAFLDFDDFRIYCFAVFFPDLLLVFCMLCFRDG